MQSGKITKDDIGKTVYLSSSYSVCQEWLIADINHDDTKGTVDLFPRYVLNQKNKVSGYYNDTVFDSSDSNSYNGSSVDTRLNKDCYNGFADVVKSSMCAMKKEGFMRYVIAPSLIELNEYRSNNDEPPIGYYWNSGSPYPLFESSKYYPLYYYPDDSNTDAQDYWVRTSIRSNSNALYVVGKGGMSAGTAGCVSYCSPSMYGKCMIGVIRFGKQ